MDISVSVSSEVSDTSRNVGWLVEATRFLMLEPLDTPRSLGELLDMRNRRNYINTELISGCVRDTLVDDPERALTRGPGGEISHVKSINKAIIKNDLKELSALRESDFRLFASLICQDKWTQEGTEFSFIFKRSDCEDLHQRAQHRNLTGSIDTEKRIFADPGLAGRFSRVVFIKAELGYTIIASIYTGAIFDWKEEIKPDNSALLMATERAAELLVQAETMRKGPHGCAVITVKIFRDTRYPELLTDGYPEALMDALASYAKKLGHNHVTKTPASIQRFPVNHDTLVLEELLNLIHPQWTSDRVPNLRLEFEFTRIMGYPTHSTAQVPGYWDANHMMYPKSLREKYGAFFERWISRECTEVD